MVLRWIIFISIYILVDVYAFQAVKTLTRNYWVYGLWMLISLLVLVALIYQLGIVGSEKTIGLDKMYVFGFFLVVFVPKLILIILMFGEDIIRLFVGFLPK